MMQYPFLAIASMIISGFGIAGALIIAWMGWLRTSRKGYLVLAAWALVSMVGLAVSWSVWPLSQKLGVKTEVAYQMMMYFNLVQALVSYVLLLAGLGLLVLGEPRQTESIES